MIVWLIGLSASGKTTVAKEMLKILSSTDEKWVLLDGDAVRSLYKDDLGHDLSGRRENSNRLRNLCSFFDSQNINVLACVLSVFPDHQLENRKKFQNYKQVYLKASLSILESRDNKNLYKSAKEGLVDNVVGVQIPFPEPVQSDVTVEVESKKPNEIAEIILLALGLSHGAYPYADKRLWKSEDYKYQYTKFQGRSLYAHYKQKRLDYLSYMGERIDNLKKSSMLSLDIKNITLDSLLGVIDVRDNSLSASIDFIQLLRLHFTEVLKNKNMTAMNKKFLFKVIKKFEVTKKIFPIYEDAELKTIKGQKTRILEHALFGAFIVNCVPFLSFEERPIALNCLLKINDKIISEVMPLVLPEENLFAYMAVSGELNLMGDIYAL